MFFPQIFVQCELRLKDTFMSKQKNKNKTEQSIIVHKKQPKRNTSKNIAMEKIIQ